MYQWLLNRVFKKKKFICFAKENVLKIKPHSVKKKPMEKGQARLMWLFFKL